MVRTQSPKVWSASSVWESVKLSPQAAQVWVVKPGSVQVGVVTMDS